MSAITAGQSAARPAIWDQPRRWYALATLVICILVIGLDTTILYVALPELAGSLKASNNQLQWILNAFLLVFAGLMLPFGLLADRWGRRRLLLAGLVFFGLASAGASYAGSAGSLIAWRALMGLGAAVLMPVSLSMLSVLFAPEQRARALAIWTSGVGLGLPIGPLVGGWLLEHYWWGSVFLINLPILAVALVAGWFLFPESRDANPPRLDWLGALLCTGGVSLATYGVTEAQSRGWSDVVTIGSLVVGGLLLVAFLLWEHRVTEPMIDVALFISRQFSQATLALGLVYFALLGFLFLLTPYLQAVRGHTSLGTGVRMLPLVGAMIVGALTADAVAPRTGPRGPVFAGLTLVGVGSLLFTRVGLSTSDAGVSGYMAVIGAGVGLTLATAVHAALETLPDQRSGMGAGLTSAFRQVGGAFGVAVLGTVLGTGYANQIGPALRGLPASAANPARDEVGAALTVAGRVGGPAGQALATAARQAYIDNMHSALVVAAIVAFVGAASVLFLMPGRHHEVRSAEAAPATHQPAPVPASGTAKSR